MELFKRERTVQLFNANLIHVHVFSVSLCNHCVGGVGVAFSCIEGRVFKSLP